MAENAGTREGRHAYLILAHKNWGQLQKLIHMLDDRRNDIFVHIDRKSSFSMADKQLLLDAVSRSRLVFVERVAVSWGGYSTIRAEMNLLRASVRGHYQYYHYISGMDLPIKTQDEIHSFFAWNAGKEFIAVETGQDVDRLEERLRYYWPFQEVVGRPGGESVFRKAQVLCIRLQVKLGIDRLRGLKYAKGDSWYSITDDLAQYIVEHEGLIHKWLKYTLCGDESFVQLMAIHSGRLHSCYRSEPGEGVSAILRLIDWERGTTMSPYTFGMSDYDLLLQSENLFARKFDETVDCEIVKAIYNYIIKRQGQ